MGGVWVNKNFAASCMKYSFGHPSWLTTQKKNCPSEARTHDLPIMKHVVTVGRCNQLSHGAPVCLFMNVHHEKS
jgi:hypothetical protein